LPLPHSREQREEDLAPSSQRHAVLNADGDILREARVRRDGITFIRSSPLRHMLARGEKRAERGEMAVIELRHVQAAERLQTAWDLVVRASGWERATTAPCVVDAARLP
jgi:hypothetical protein